MIVTGFVVFSLGLAPVVTLAISETCAEFGGALGIAILGSIFTAVYRRGMADAIPNGLPPDAVEAARATLGGAVAAAGDLHDSVGAELLRMAREAFTRAFELSAAISAAIVLVVAVAAAVLLRRVRAGSESGAQPA